MSPSGLPARSLTWRLLPWLVPVGLILVGLVFVTASLSDSDQSKPVNVAPENVRALVTESAEVWAVSQVGSEVTTAIADVLMVDAAATGSSTYSTRAVIVRLDSRVLPDAAAAATAATLAEADKSTVATCIFWDVDVSAKTVVHRAATEVQREAGHHELTDTEGLREQCAAAEFAG